jgi:hypothetical protein
VLMDADATESIASRVTNEMGIGWYAIDGLE